MIFRQRASKRYARALFDLANESGALAEVRNDVDALLALVRDTPELSAFFDNYLLPRSARKAFLESAFSGRLNPLTYRFLLLVEEKKRGGLLADICAGFIDRHDAMQGIVRGTAASPYALDPESMALLSAYAQAKIKGQPRLEPVRDPFLLGGVRLQLGDTVYDMSMAAQLRMLREKMIGA